MSEQANPFTLIDGLIDGWCERRALNSLRRILPVYPLANGLTDGWHVLYDALRDVRAFCRDELSAEEQLKLGEAIDTVQRVLES